MKVKEDLAPVGPEVFAVTEDVGLRVGFLAEWAASVCVWCLSGGDSDVVSVPA
jgi:hypothetical protein